MTNWQHIVPWVVVLCLISSSFGSVLGSIVGMKVCSKHWQCPLYTRKHVEDWTKDMVKERVRNKVVREDPESPPERLPGEEFHESVPVR
jgi:hypothetical protein